MKSDMQYKLGSNYIIQMDKKLGSGAFGIIYKGFNLKSNEEVAIKMVKRFFYLGIFKSKTSSIIL